MRKIILIFGIIILNYSCKSNYSIVELENNFSDEDISDLNKVIRFFKNEMCLNMESDFRTCYNRIPHEYLEATGYGFWKNINFEKQKMLYKEISKSTFNEIWGFCESIIYPSDKKVKSLCTVSEGKYYKYLKDLGDRNPRIAKYAERIHASGDFNGLDIHYWEVLNKRKPFNLKDPNIQLILAIHYLSLNDQLSRNEKIKE